MLRVDRFEMAPELPENAKVVRRVFERNFEDFSLHFGVPLCDRIGGLLADLSGLRCSEQVNSVERSLGHDRKNRTRAHLPGSARGSKRIVETGECEQNFQGRLVTQFSLRRPSSWGG
jgi:hypothetical protein